MPAVATEPERKVVWQPLPGSQALVLGCPCHHILFHGSRGPGKTDAQLMAFRSRVGVGYGQFWRGIIFDRKYKNLDDLINKSKRWFPQFNDGAKFLSSNSALKWVWPTGEELLFRQMEREGDYDNYHGHEYPFIGWNELTKYPDPKCYEAMMSCNRTSFVPEEHTPRDGDGGYQTTDGQPLPEIPLTVFSTTNPHGVGHNWVKREFIDKSLPGRVHRRTTTVYNPRTKRMEDVTKTQAHVFGTYVENRYLTPEYVADLNNITEPNKRKAWLEGDWDIVAGGAFDDLWQRDVHVVPGFDVPAGWRLDRSFDWGSSHPFSVGWWAEANGEEVVLEDGRTWCPPRGSLVRVAEWYGTEALGHNLGLKLSAKEIALGIRRRERQLRQRGRVGKKAPIFAGPADNQIRNVTESDVDTIEKKMADEGVRWTRCDKSPGSRINGMQMVRDRLEASVSGEGPGLFFTHACSASITLLPTLPRDEKQPDDVDTDAEDHIYDDIRYRVLASNNRSATAVKMRFAI